MPTKTRKRYSGALPLLSSHSSKDGGRALAAEPTSEVRRRRMCDAQWNTNEEFESFNAMTMFVEVDFKAIMRQRWPQTARADRNDH